MGAKDQKKTMFRGQKTHTPHCPSLSITAILPNEWRVFTTVMEALSTKVLRVKWKILIAFP